jgi:hypothetical protein
LDLELPSVTLAERLARVLVPLAGAYASWTLLAQGHGIAAALVMSGATVAFVVDALADRRSGQQRGRLRLGADGVLHLQAGGSPEATAELGPGTRRLGPSVFLDLRVTSAGGRRRMFLWLTPFDVTAADLRRWTVALPLCGGVVGP